jgi:hypothetical protein
MDEELFGSGKGHESHYVSFKKRKQDWKGFQSQRLYNEWQSLWIMKPYDYLTTIFFSGWQLPKKWLLSNCLRHCLI